MERLTKQNFDALYEIMEKSFPVDERRPYEGQKALFERPNYEVYAREQDGETVGFIAAWRFDAFLYIEHFAVNPAFRNGGIGAAMLRELSESESLPLCLEVELPETEMACRRIKFYERNGFFYNDYPYVQPPISAGKNPVPLRVMTSGGHIAREAFEEIRKTLYTEVYGVSATYR